MQVFSTYMKIEECIFKRSEDLGEDSNTPAPHLAARVGGTQRIASPDSQEVSSKTAAPTRSLPGAWALL